MTYYNNLHNEYINLIKIDKLRTGLQILKLFNIINIVIKFIIIIMTILKQAILTK